MRFGKLIALAVAALPAVGNAQRVAFYGDNGAFASTLVANGTSWGWTVDVFNNATPLANPIGTYDVLITGDWSVCCFSPAGYASLTAMSGAINAARGSRTFISGQDADYHEYYGSKVGAAELFMKNAVNWAAGGTGLGIVALDASNWWGTAGTPLFAELAGHWDFNSGNTVIIPGPTAGFPVNSGLTSSDLSDWNSSYHNTFDATTPGYLTINLAGDYWDYGRAVTLVSEAEAGGGLYTAPEPGSIILLATGLGGLGLGAVRRRRQA